MKCSKRYNKATTLTIVSEGTRMNHKVTLGIIPIWIITTWGIAIIIRNELKHSPDWFLTGFFIMLIIIVAIGTSIVAKFMIEDF